MVPKSTGLDKIKGQMKPKADWRAVDRQQNTLMSNYTEKMSLVPDD